jgi:hypothetical protein
VNNLIEKVVAFSGSVSHRSLDHWFRQIRIVDGKRLIRWLRHEHNLGDRDVRWHLARLTRDRRRIADELEQMIEDLVAYSGLHMDGVQTSSSLHDNYSPAAYATQLQTAISGVPNGIALGNRRSSRVGSRSRVWGMRPWNRLGSSNPAPALSSRTNSGDSILNPRCLCVCCKGIEHTVPGTSNSTRNDCDDHQVPRPQQCPEKSKTRLRQC